MKHYKKSKILGSALALMLLFSWGCGPDEVTPPPFPPPSNNTDDVGPGDEPDGWENNWNNPPDGGFPAGCEPNLDLGAIRAPYTRSLNDIVTAKEGRATVCYEESEESGHWLMTFRLDNPSIVTLDVLSPIGDNPVYQLNYEACLTDSPQFCAGETSRQVFIGEPGTYYLWVEKPEVANLLRFDVRIELEELVCFPGELLCSDGDVEVCNQGRRWRELGSCATECKDETTCAGDVCDDAIVVELSPVGPNRAVHFKGDRHAFTNQWDAEGRQGCYVYKNELEEGDDDIGSPTRNGEVFFRVPGLRTGQRLSVEAATFGGNYGFYVLSDCGAEGCLGAATIDEEARRRLNWEVPADGAYIVVVESMGADARSFELVFELSNN